MNDQRASLTDLKADFLETLDMRWSESVPACFEEMPPLRLDLVIAGAIVAQKEDQVSCCSVLDCQQRT